MNLNELLNMGAKDLPEGWKILIEVENGYGGLSLEDPNGLCHNMCDGSIEEQFTHAIEYAKKQN